MEAIDVKGTVAFVRSGFTSARAEKLAASEMTTEGIWFVFSFHVFTLPLPSENQWIDSLSVRLA
jgi:hypothetical protein